MSEAVKSDRDRKETAAAHRYRPRRRRGLSAAEQQEIIDAYVRQYIPQREIAKRFRVTHNLVSGLVQDSKKRPEKLRAVKEREKLQ